MLRKITSAILATAMAASIFTFGFTNQSFASDAAITEEGAITIAVEDAKVDKAQDAKAEKVTENGAEVFHVTFYVGKAKITYCIDAASGAIKTRHMNNAPVAN